MGTAIRAWAFAGLLATLLAAPLSAIAVPLIDTTGAAFRDVASFGEPDTATYGQTFMATGPETQLNSFSFRFDDDVRAFTPDFIDFAAYVYAWDGAKAVGPALYASAPQASTNNGGAGGLELFTFNTGGVQLTSGQRYVAFVSGSLFFDGVASFSLWELSLSTAAYPDGSFVFFNNLTDFGALTTQAWDCSDTCDDRYAGDLWFRATFSTPLQVPEPSSFALLSIALAGAGAVLRRRARQRFASGA